MSSSTTAPNSSVPVTNGYSPWVPSPGVVIRRIIPSDGTTGGQPARQERVYPPPSSEPE